MKKPKKPAFPLIPFAKLKPGNEPEWLVQGLIPRIGVTVVWGPPKCGKSFWTYDVTMHVAMNRKWRDRKVVGGSVVFCAFEGGMGFAKRAEAYRLYHKVKNADFFLMPQRIGLISQHEDLIDSIAAQCEDPVVVVLDTLNRSLEGSENDAQAMGAYVAAADAIKDAFDCAVVIVHHCGIVGERPRGHTSLSGAADAQLKVTRNKRSKKFAVEVDFMKDGDDEAPKVWNELFPVGIAQDVTSCVVIAATADTTEHGLDGDDLKAVEILGGNTMSVDRWREHLKANKIIKPDSTNPRQDFKRLRERLEKKSAIIISNDEVRAA